MKSARLGSLALFIPRRPSLHLRVQSARHHLSKLIGKLGVVRIECA
jgi:hypothetical protein